MTTTCDQCVDLAACRLGSSGTVSCVLAASAGEAEALSRRLAELGIRPGAHVTAVQATPGGGRIIGVNGTRLALDRATLQSLHITHLAA